jgi:tripartite-type tricarboxylate transporter receptor subunit TctC
MSDLRRRSLLAGATPSSPRPPLSRRSPPVTGQGPPQDRRAVPTRRHDTDPVARIIAAKVSDNTGLNTVIDNKPGAAGAIGPAIAAKPPTRRPDLNGDLRQPHPESRFHVQPHLQGLGPAERHAGRPCSAHRRLPDRPAVQHLRRRRVGCKQRPGKPSIGLLSASGALLLAMYLQKANGFELNQIYYKGGGPTVQDLLAGVTDLSITTLGAVRPHVQAGKLKALSTTGDKRPPSLPDTPTLAELGLKSYPTYSWWGVYAPAGTPQPIVERMHAELVKAVGAPDVRQKFADQVDMEILGSTPLEFAAFQKAEQERWFKVIQDNGIKAE